MNARTKCPTCETPVALDPANKWRPFCSERCMLIDLGEWINERRGIPADEDADGSGEDPGSPSTH